MKNVFVKDNIFEYLLNYGVKESGILKEIRDFTSKMPNSIMQISSEQGQFIGVLVKALNVKKAIEIGTFTGYSSIVIASSMGIGGKLICCDVNKQWTDIAEQFWQKAGLEEKIDLFLKPAEETLNDLLNKKQEESFDLAFIDGDKKNYEIYYELCLKLIKKNGIILIDNTLWKGKVLDINISDDKITKLIHDFNVKIYNDNRVESNILAIGDGLTIVVKK